MRLAGVLTTAALGTLGTANAVNIQRSFISLSSTAASMQLGGLPTLQEALDKKCRDEALRACKAGEKHYCDVAVYARWDIGVGNQAKDWRCYHEESLNFSIAGEGCIDQCGNKTMCMGAIEGNSKWHMTRPGPLTKVINDNKDAYCQAQAPTLQHILDKFCFEQGANACKGGTQNYCNTSMYARFDLGTGEQRAREWRCYAKMSLDFNKYGPGCIDSCGRPLMCIGSVNGESVVHLTRHKELDQLINKNKEAYCNITGRSIQEVLDRTCVDIGQEACKADKKFCGYRMYARFDVGNSSERTKEWRCYADKSIKFHSSSNVCSDNCGKLTTCDGAVVGSSSLHINKNEQLLKVIADNKNAFCGK